MKFSFALIRLSFVSLLMKADCGASRHGTPRSKASMSLKLALLFCLLIAMGQSLPAVAQESKIAATETAQASAPAPEVKTETDIKRYLIGTGDTLDVIVARRPELNWRGQVNSNGEIPALPYLEKPIRALCRTEEDLAQEIKEAYTKLVKNPEITVRVIERSTRPVILLGAIRTSQRFQLQRDVRLNELLFVSGGVTDRASGDIQIFSTEPFMCTQEGASAEQTAETEKSPLKVVRILDLMAGKEEANPLVRSGDIVTVMVAEPVYVSGGVVSPQSINFRDQLTLARAITMAGGLTGSARGGDIRIYRRKQNLAETEVIKADYNAIRKQQQPDIPLKAYDIIEVPHSSSAATRRNWQTAAQEVVMDEKQSAALPLRVLN